MPLRKWGLVAALLFGAGFALGLVTPAEVTGTFAGDIETLRELSRILAPFHLSTAVFIFVKNTMAVAISFLFSPILLLMPLAALVLNGWLLAFVAAMVTQQESVLYVLAGVLPHGIFEIPALILGEAAALSFGTVVILALFGKRDRSQVVASLRQNLRYLGVSVLLLVPAAVLETFITPLLIG